LVRKEKSKNKSKFGCFFFVEFYFFDEKKKNVVLRVINFIFKIEYNGKTKNEQKEVFKI